MTEKYYDTLTLLTLDPLTALSILAPTGHPYVGLRHPACLAKHVAQIPVARERFNAHGAVVMPGTGQRCDQCGGWFQ